MERFNKKNRLIFILIFSFMLRNLTCGQEETNKYRIYKKNQWVKNLVSRSKRSYEESLLLKSNKQIEKQCPMGCTCSSDTINCNDLIETCEECINWHQIDFNQISEMKANTFRYFKFAPNRTTHIIIYKLLNSTLSAKIFENLHVPANAQLEITFQYNSVIKLDKFALNGVSLSENSTLVFNFPYTTQVIFVSKCFDGIHMTDLNSRLIIRILKSFSVRFVGDVYSQNFIHMKKARLSFFHENNNTSTSGSSSQTEFSTKSKENTSNDNWSLSTGQLIIDIKSTHLVKFEDKSFSHLKLKSQAKIYIDLDIIEKLMIQRHSFSHMNLGTNTKFTIYAKHITFIDFKAFSFSHITMWSQSSMQIYLEELISSLCLQRNVFSYLRLHQDHCQFNFSIINSKNVMLMHDSFSNINVDSKTARLFIGVFSSPSYLLRYNTNNNYQTFLKERAIYKWSQINLNNNDNYDQYSNHFAPPFSISNAEYFYNHGLNSNQVLVNNDVNKQDLNTFYTNNKQTYAYNVSVERNCFYNMKFNYETTNNENNQNIWIVADNIKTLLVDDYIIDYPVVNGSNTIQNNTNINFLLNVKYFVLSPNSLQNINQLRAEFLREPKLIKFGIMPLATGKSIRQIKLIGIDLNSIKTVRDSSEQEQDNLDDPYQTDQYHSLTIENYCHIASSNDTFFNIESRVSAYNSQLCSCQSIYMVLNQIKDLKSALRLLNCRLTDYNFVLNCRKQLEEKCDSNNNKEIKYDDKYLVDFVKFWDYCITEQDPLHDHFQSQQDQQQHHLQQQHLNQNQAPKSYFFSNSDLDTGNNLYFNNFNDPDGMFSASLSSSSSFFDQPIDSFNKPPSFISSAPTQILSNNNNINNNNLVAGNIGKIIGIVIVSFLSGIILFMIVVNIIQYKFRNELLDYDIDYSSQFNNNNNNNTTNSNNNDNNNNTNRNQDDFKSETNCTSLDEKSNESNANKNDFYIHEKKKFISTNLKIKSAISEESLKYKDLNKIRSYKIKRDYYDEHEDDDYDDDDDDEYVSNSNSDEYYNEKNSIKESNHNINKYESDSLFDEDEEDSINKKRVKFMNTNKISSQMPKIKVKAKLSQDSGEFSEVESDRIITRQYTPPPPYKDTSILGKENKKILKNKISQA